MNNVISIGLFRVSGDSKNLDMIFDCPQDYYFDSLQLQVKFVDGDTFKSKFFDLSPALFNTEISDKCTIKKKHWVVRLPLDKLEINIPAIYIATLKVEPVYTQIITGDGFKYALPIPYNNPDLYEIRDNSGTVYELNSGTQLVGYDGEPVVGKVYNDDCTAVLPPTIEPDTMVCSDVNQAYRCMLDELLMKEGACDDLVSDELIRKYLLLYGHTAALTTRDMETAETYFKLIGKCFSKCGSSGRGSGSCCSSNSGCVDNSQYNRMTSHSCNCGK